MPNTAIAFDYFQRKVIFPLSPELSNKLSLLSQLTGKSPQEVLREALNESLNWRLDEALDDWESYGWED